LHLLRPGQKENATSVLLNNLLRPIHKICQFKRLTYSFFAIKYITVTGRRIVVLHAFVKKSQKTPRSAIETALRRKKEADL